MGRAQTSGSTAATGIQGAKPCSATWSAGYAALDDLKTTDVIRATCTNIDIMLL